MFVHPQPSQSRRYIIIQAECRVTVFEIGIPPKNFDHRSGRVVLPDLRHLQCSRLKFLPNMIIVSEPREKAYGIIPVARKLYLSLFHYGVEERRPSAYTDVCAAPFLCIHHSMEGRNKAGLFEE